MISYYFCCMEFCCTCIVQSVPWPSGHLSVCLSVCPMQSGSSIVSKQLKSFRVVLLNVLQWQLIADVSLTVYLYLWRFFFEIWNNCFPHFEPYWYLEKFAIVLTEWLDIHTSLPPCCISCGSQECAEIWTIKIDKPFGWHGWNVLVKHHWRTQGRLTVSKHSSREESFARVGTLKGAVADCIPTSRV